ncbi:helix-turn-helix domain-containing protein [Streptomyces sp. 6N223]|uniref:helix-turn-helix domain-containing protein n=1 Tax=Streptomyces sp. 6N223 TaxID=3457412 RepID=UPI003FD290A2
MPPRSSPTARQQRLGTELRKMREQAGLSAQGAADLLGLTRSRVSNIEAGRFGVSANRVRTFASAYRCPDEELVEALAGMAGERRKGWWEQYRGELPSTFLDIAELEWHAKSVRTAVIAHIPGLLQTEDHVRAMFAMADPPLPALQVLARTTHRLKRQAVLDRDDLLEFTAIVHEAALRMQFGGRRTAKGQLRHILETSERDNVTVCVIPFEAGGFPGAGQSVIYASASIPQLDTVLLDTFHGGALIDIEMQLRRYRKLLDRMEGLALSPEESRDFIRDMAHEL